MAMFLQTCYSGAIQLFYFIFSLYSPFSPATRALTSNFPPRPPPPGLYLELSAQEKGLVVAPSLTWSLMFTIAE